MKDEGRNKLLFGPYEPPKIPRSKRLFCEMRGYLKIGGYSDGPIPWPRRYRTNSIILCGDLVRAVKQESVEAVSFHWGVCRNVVQNWRKALEVPEHNPGTRQLLHRTRTGLEPQTRQRAEVRAKNRAEILPRRPLVHERSHPLRRPATSQLVKERIARTGHVNPDLRLWTPREDKLVGSGPDDEIARKLGRTRIAVAARRRILGIASWNYTYHRLWTDKEEGLLGVVPDRKLAAMLQRPFKGIQARRELKGCCRPSLCGDASRPRKIPCWEPNQTRKWPGYSGGM